MQDHPFDFDSLTVLEDESLFNIEEMSNKPWEVDEFTAMTLSFEVNMDQIVITRSNYTVLDLLSDIGGIQGILAPILSIPLIFFNYKHFDTFMASKLYKIKK